MTESAPPPPASLFPGGARYPNVVLIGARTSGKSRASRAFAEATGWTRVSTDERIEERLGPIPAFVERHGWERFRNEESAVLAAISGEQLVVDCGGGIVERPGNIRRLAALGTVYWMRAPVPTLAERLSRPALRRARPPLPGTAPEQEAGVVLERRTPLYREAAGYDIWSSGPGEAAEHLRAAHFGPRLALSVAAETPSEAKAGLAAASREAGPEDLIELRVDPLRIPAPKSPAAGLAELLESLPESLLARLIVTVRRREEGGRFRGSEEQRISLLLEAAHRGAGYLDLEYEADLQSGGAISRRLREAAPRVRLVASVHDLDTVPDDLETLPERMAAMKPSITKIAAAGGQNEVRRIHALIRRRAAAGRPIVGIALGPAGAALRVIARGAGASIGSYASPPGLPTTAPGQLDAAAIRDRDRRWGRRLRAPVPVYGVVGSPIAHSLSPPMQEAAFRRLDLDRAYLAFDAPPGELADFLIAARLTGVRGLNVTIPHKRAILPLLDGLDADARRIGAVNTILPMEGGLVGANTDWIGAVRALEETVPLTGRRATVLGAGGAARAVLHGLLRRGAEALVVSRDERKAAALAGEFGARHAPRSRLGRLAGDILVNATPVGMSPAADRCPAPEAAIAGHEVVFDLVFSPPQTIFLETARRLGRKTVPGLRMLIHQAAAAFERWTGKSAPLETMVAAARRAEEARRADDAW